MKIKTVIEAKYKGFEYKVKNVGFEESGSFRTIGNTNWYNGYVKIPKEHPIYEKNYWDIDEINCHGGLTYSGMQDDGYWIGFDCNHWLDTPDHEDASYAERECLEIIDQLVKMAVKHEKA